MMEPSDSIRDNVTCFPAYSSQPNSDRSTKKTSFASQPDTSTVAVCVSACASELIISRLHRQKSSSSAINREPNLQSSSTYIQHALQCVQGRDNEPIRGPNWADIRKNSGISCGTIRFGNV